MSFGGTWKEVCVNKHLMDRWPHPEKDLKDQIMFRSVNVRTKRAWTSYTTVFTGWLTSQCTSNTRRVADDDISLQPSRYVTEPRRIRRASSSWRRYILYGPFHRMKLQSRGQKLTPGWQCQGGGELNMGAWVAKSRRLHQESSPTWWHWRMIHPHWSRSTCWRKLNHFQ